MNTDCIVFEEDMAPLIVNKEEEGEDGNDEAGDYEHNNHQSRVHVLLLHYCYLHTFHYF